MPYNPDDILKQFSYSSKVPVVKDLNFGQEQTLDEVKVTNKPKPLHVVQGAVRGAIQIKAPKQSHDYTKQIIIGVVLLAVLALYLSSQKK